MAKEKKAKKKSTFWKDFKSFATRGNVVDMAVGVIIGGAFSAIVNSFVSILLNVCTWGVPGGLKGLVTTLPAFPGNAAQEGPVGQEFLSGEIVEKTQAFAAAQGVTNLQVTDATYVQWQTALLGKYTLHGTKYVFNNCAYIDWGAFLNAVISFLIVAFVLFLIVKAVAAANAKKAELEAKAREAYYEKHPEERPAPVEPGVPAPTSEQLLAEILTVLKEKKEA